MRARYDADPGISRFPILFALVGLLIAASTIAFVVVESDSDANSSDGTRAAERPTATAPATGSVPTSSRTPSTATTASTPTSTPPTATSTPPAAKKTPLPGRQPITYTVRKGDNLTVIAQWFKLQGYCDLYERNRDVIGDNPDLIYPGQRITVSEGGMSVSR